MIVAISHLLVGCYRSAADPERVIVKIEEVSAPAIHTGSSVTGAGPGGFLLVPGPHRQGSPPRMGEEDGAPLSYFSLATREFRVLTSEAARELQRARIEFVEPLGARFFVVMPTRAGLLDPEQETWTEALPGPLAGLAVLSHVGIPGAVLLLGVRNGSPEAWSFREDTSSWVPLPTEGLPPLGLGRRAVWNGARWVVLGKDMNDRWRGASWALGDAAWTAIPFSDVRFEPGELFSRGSVLFTYGCERYDLLWASSCTFGVFAISLADGRWRSVATGDSRWRAIDLSGHTLIAADGDGHGRAWNIDTRRGLLDFAFPRFDTYVGGDGLLFAWGDSQLRQQPRGGVYRGDEPWAYSNTAAVITWTVERSR